jgi:plastocyanin
MSKLTTLTILATLAGTSAAYADVTGTVEAKPSKFLKDTIVYVKSVPGTKLTPKTLEIDQKGMAFEPHIVVGAVGDTVKFHNHDKVDHNVNSPDAKFDMTMTPGETKEHAFTAEGVFSQVCKIHPEMLAYVFIGQNRFATQVDDKGAFKIAGLPAGTYELVIWNAKLKAPSQKITVDAKGNATAKFSLAR